MGDSTLKPCYLLHCGIMVRKNKMVRPSAIGFNSLPDRTFSSTTSMGVIVPQRPPLMIHTAPISIFSAAPLVLDGIAAQSEARVPPPDQGTTSPSSKSRIQRGTTSAEQTSLGTSVIVPSATAMTRKEWEDHHKGLPLVPP